MDPMLLKKVKPQYPGIADMNQVQGEVVVQALIDTSGEVVEVKGLSGPVQLMAGTTSAVKQWRYRPFLVNGQAYEVETLVTFNFTLNQ